MAKQIIYLTKRFAKEIVRQVLDSNIRSIAEKNDVSEEEIQSMIDASEEEIKVEGINNKLKLIKRLGDCFRNFSNFRLRCLLSW